MTCYPVMPQTIIQLSVLLNNMLRRIFISRSESPIVHFVKHRYDVPNNLQSFVRTILVHISWSGKELIQSKPQAEFDKRQVLFDLAFFVEPTVVCNEHTKQIPTYKALVLTPPNTIDANVIQLWKRPPNLRVKTPVVIDTIRMIAHERQAQEILHTTILTRFRT